MFHDNSVANLAFSLVVNGHDKREFRNGKMPRTVVSVVSPVKIGTHANDAMIREKVYVVSPVSVVNPVNSPKRVTLMSVKTSVKLGRKRYSWGKNLGQAKI
jgi:hypothetical protein